MCFTYTAQCGISDVQHCISPSAAGQRIRFKGYAFQIEMKFTAYKCGFKIKEVPVIFVNRELGTSKMSGGIFSEALFGVIRLKVSSWFRKYPQKQIS